MPSHALSTEPWDRYARELGHNIQRERARVGYSQDRVAYEANLSRYTYQKLEKGESRPGTPANPTVKTLLAVAQVLGVTITDLLPTETPDLTYWRTGTALHACPRGVREDRGELVRRRVIENVQP